MIKFSVKKPLTIFVAVLAVIMMGLIAFSRMTPDLFPNMDFPYIIVVTTYPGASPEVVEEEVTKPLEEEFATLEQIKEISSTSSENYSMVALEFENETDLDSAGFDISESISQLSSSWDDAIQTPYMLKINPSVIPISMAAVSMEGYDIIELSDLVENDLGTALEGTDGVASVTVTGLVSSKVHVVISQDKIDTINQALEDAINGQLEDAQAELEEARSEISSAQSEMEAAEDEILSGQESLASEIGDASGTLTSKQSELLAAMVNLKEQIFELTEQKEELEETLEQLKNVDSLNGNITAQVTVIESQLETLQSLQEALESEDEATLAAAEAQLEAMGYTEETLSAAINALYAAVSASEEAQTELEDALAGTGVTLETLPEAISQIESAVSQLETAISELTDMVSKIEEGSAELAEAQSLLVSSQISGVLQICEAYTQIAVNSSSLESALTQIEEAQSELDASRDKALSQADMSGQITISTIAAILSAQDFSMPAGYVEEDGESYMVSVGDEITSLDELENLLLFDSGVEGVGEIYLSDVCDIYVTDNSGDSYAKLDGHDGIILSFQKQSNAATADVSDALVERFEELEEEYPGLTFATLYDQGEYIHLIINSILSSLLYGAAFAVIILFIFLRNIRPTIITVVAIPASLIFTVALMYFTGISMNMISMSGIAVAVGMVVDNSIVVIENIFRFRNKGATAAQAAAVGTKQVAGAVTASTLTTIFVFLPIVFTSGYTKEIFSDLALTVSFSLAASLALSLTLVPAMASLMFKKDSIVRPKKPVEHLFYRIYRRAVRWCLKRKWIVLPLALILLIATAFLAVNRGFSFMPDLDADTVTLNLAMPEGTGRDEAVKMSDEILNRITYIDDVQHVGAIMGSTMYSSSLSGESYGITIYVDMADGISGEDTGKQIEKMCADLDCEITSSSSSGLSMSTLTGSGVQINIYGDDIEDMQKAAKQIAAALSTVDGIASVDDGLKDADTAYHVSVDKNEAMKYSYTVAQVYQKVAAKLSSSVTAIDIDVEGITADVLVESKAAVSLSDLKALEFEYTDDDGNDATARLDQIALITETTSLDSINRENQQRYVQVSAMLEDGKNVTKTTTEAQTALEKLELPRGITYEFGGENEVIMEAVTQVIMMVTAGIALVYFVMVAQFQSLKSPFIVLFTIPLAFTGGFGALLIFGMDVSVISMIGLVMLTGVIVNNGIVLVDYINQLRIAGMERKKAIEQAGVTRMRPVYMTTLTTILGLVVMALGQDMGTKMIQPMAVVCIGGLLYGTVMTLFVIPCIYDIFSRKPIHAVKDEDLEYEDVAEAGEE